jgi:citrate lyase subunit beta/citryl-CoA lyase
VRADVAAAVRSGADGLLFPETRALQDLDDVDCLIQDELGARPHARHFELLALIETPEAIDLVDHICTAERRTPLTALVYGREDITEHLGLPLRYEVDWPEIGSLVARSRVVWAAKRSRIAILDSVPARLDDAEVLAFESGIARSLGFTGRTCIHPRQVEGIDRAFTPTEQEVTAAERALSAYKRAVAEGRVVAVADTAMIDRPIAKLHEATIEHAAYLREFDAWKSRWRPAAGDEGKRV